MAKKGVEAVERALRLLNAFSEQQPAMTLTELSQATDLYKSTVLRITASLERYDYLNRRDNGEFVIGAAARRLGQLHGASFDLEALVRPELIRLAEESGETASLYVVEGEQRLCLYRENSHRAARHHLEEGVTLPLASGASGRLLGAWGHPHSPENQTIIKQGYVVSLGERDPDLAAIAVPMIDHKGTMHGALALSGIITRFTPENIETMLTALQGAAKRLREAE